MPSLTNQSQSISQGDHLERKAGHFRNIGLTFSCGWTIMKSKMSFIVILVEWLNVVPSKEPAFITTGFLNWKNALMRFRSHKKSTCHHVAIERVAPQIQDVAEMPVSEHEKKSTIK